MDVFFVCSPTDFTDSHRMDWQRMFSHRFHGIHRIDWQRMFSHRFHRFSQMVCVCSSVNSVCSVGPPTPQ